MNRILWARADVSDDYDIRKQIVTSALENDILTLFTRSSDDDTFRKLGRFDRVHVDDNKFEVDGEKGVFIDIVENSDVERAASLVNEFDIVVVSTGNWKVIPLENLIAAFQPLHTKLISLVGSIEEAELFLNTLETGVDGLVLDTDDISTIIDIKKLMDETVVDGISLVKGKITSLKQLGSGDRVCIDTCSMMVEGEGMLIGSSSRGLFLVHSESVRSEYVDPRPFRVNAGPVHSYIQVPGDRTRYLADLKVGDEVLVVDPSGSTRTAVIGRLKIEKRPLMLLESEVNGNRLNIILQNAETIRLVSGGNPVSIVDLKVGDDILIKIDEGGRHFGMRINETIVEK